MTNLKTYLEGILDTEGYDAWAEANDELMQAVDADDELWLQDEELHYVTDWAKAHNIDLTAGCEGLGGFVTYFQMWLWDNYED